MTEIQTQPRLALRPKEAAEAIGIGLSNMRALIASGAVKSVRIGSCILVTPEALMELIASSPSGVPLSAEPKP